LDLPRLEGIAEQRLTQPARRGSDPYLTSTVPIGFPISGGKTMMFCATISSVNHF